MNDDNAFSNYTPYFEPIGKILDVNAALVFGKIYAYTKNTGVCYASNSRIAEELGLSLNTVIRAKNRLIDFLFILDVTPEYCNSKTQVRHYSINKVKVNSSIEEYKKNYKPKPKSDILKRKKEHYSTLSGMGDNPL